MSSDYGDFCREMRERRKKSKIKNYFKAHEENGIINKLIKLGAAEKAEGVYRLEDNDIYPYKGWVRNFRNNKSCSLKYWLKQIIKEEKME